MIKQLSECVGISGYEKQVRDYIISKIQNCAELHTDRLGNLIAVSNKGGDKPAIVISAHMDEPGLIITDITDDGYLKFDIIGDIAPDTLLSQRVIIGDIIGIISFKAIHLTTKEERKKQVKTSDLLIDIGAETKDEAKSRVRVGDLCSFDTKFCEIGENSIKGKALGSRICCSVLIDILKQAALLDLNLMGIFTVQREVSSRGAYTAFDSVKKANLAILTDCVNCSENIKSGDGAVLGFSVDQDRYAAKYAQGLNVKVQLAKMDKCEQDILLEKRCDIPIIQIAIPCKYKNTSVNIADKNDISTMSELIFKLVRSVENGTFI